MAEWLTSKAPVSPTLYGLMTEEINCSYDGGLYAELVASWAQSATNTRSRAAIATCRNPSENDGYSDSEWFDAQSEPEGPPVQNGSRLQVGT
jgi:hypothetical protein